MAFTPVTFRISASYSEIHQDHYYIMKKGSGTKVSSDKPIAVLDSGVGGLTVAKEIMRQLPQETIIYFGDTARAPYGPRPREEVVVMTLQIIEFLLHFQPKLIVIACNTATAAALETVRSLVDLPVLGVIAPGARAAIQATQSGRIGVIGTQGTIQSGAYEKELKQLSPSVHVVSKSCPSLVTLVEREMFRSAETQAAVCDALGDLKDEPIDTLILGCTHYPFLSPYIQRCMGSGVQLISSADQTAKEVGALLRKADLLAGEGGRPRHRFLCSGDSGLFQSIARMWLGEQLLAAPALWQVSSL